MVRCSDKEAWEESSSQFKVRYIREGKSRQQELEAVATSQPQLETENSEMHTWLTLSIV